MKRKLIAIKKVKQKESKFKAWWKITRARHPIMVFIVILIAATFLAKNFGIQFQTNFILFALGPSLITAGAFIANDLFDYERNKKEKRLDRPLIAGSISIKEASSVMVILFVIGLIISYLAGLTAFLITLFYFVLSLVYVPILERTPLLGNLFIALNRSFWFLYGNFLVTNEINLMILIWCGITFFFGLGRELIISMIDMEKFKKRSWKNIPLIFGTKTTSVFSIVLVLIGIGMGFIPLIISFSWKYLILILLADILFLISAINVFKDQSLPMLTWARSLMLNASLVTFLAFASFAIF